MNIDAAEDFASLTDNTETVTFRSLGAAGTFTDTTGVTALRRSLSRSEVNALGGAAMVVNKLVWNLDASDVASVKTGDRIKDSGNVEYVVEQAELATFRTRWRCTCKRAK